MRKQTHAIAAGKNELKDMIYLDNAATTRPDADAFRRAAEFIRENYYNPSAAYGGGFAVQREMERARRALLEHIADPEIYELIFTSGGTEADNQAVFSAARRGNAVTDAGEHAAVDRAFAALKTRGIETRIAPLNRGGGADADALLSLVDGNTTLVSVMQVNNETGAVNDIAALSKAVKERNPRAVFMSDGVQAFGKLEGALPSTVDLYAVSGHKIGAVKGIGALIKRKSLSLSPMLYGGGQERGLRSGTENVFGILDFAYAAEKKFKSLSADAVRLKCYREQLFSALDPAIFRRISPSDGSPYLLSVSAVGLRGEVLLRLLWEKGVAVGTGSACSSKNRYSRVIAACGYEGPVLDGVLRLSFSPETTEEEIREAANCMNLCARQLRERI